MPTADRSEGALAEILLVEDNSGDVRLIQEAFQQSRIPGTLRVVRDGEQALAYLRQEGKYKSSRRPDFILLDLNLPRKNGCEVLADIRQDEQLRHMPVLVISTSTRKEDVKRAYALHANGYIPKPHDLNELAALGEQLHQFWPGTTRLRPPRRVTKRASQKSA